jgi:hypothetical protein
LVEQERKHGLMVRRVWFSCELFRLCEGEYA